MQLQVSDELNLVIKYAREEAMRTGSYGIGPDHLFLGLIRQEENAAFRILQNLGVEPAELKAFIDQRIFTNETIPYDQIDHINFSRQAQNVLSITVMEATRLKSPKAETHHLLLALCRTTESYGQAYLRARGIDYGRLLAVMEDEGLLKPMDQQGNPDGNTQPSQGPEDDPDENKKLDIEEFAYDLTRAAIEGKLDPVVGRDVEISRVIQILGRRKKNNPMLIGEPGVGKSAIVEGIAQKIASGNISAALAKKRILSLDIASVVAGTKYRGDFEKRLKTIIKEASENPDIILFIDEFHTIVGAGGASGSLDAANMLKPALEEFHGITYADDAVEAAVRLTNRYITDKSLPDKAIDALDEAGSMVRLSLSKKKGASGVVEVEDIATVVSKMTGIPVNKVAESEGNRLVKMRDRLKERIIGQDEAVETVVKAIQRGRAGLKDPHRPIGTFLFFGPTGVGKTQLARTLAEYLFDSEENMVRIDMSEYMEKFSVSRLIGAPPGYVGYEEGGQLSERVRRKPYCVVLLDEIEKAHPDIFNLLLQVMDEGRLTDSNGRMVDFKNTIVIMTSNVGSREMEEYGSGIGFATAGKNVKADRKSVVEKAVKKAFPPEFINRVDAQVYFNSLDKEAIEKIIDIELKGLKARVQEAGYKLTITPTAKRFIADAGYDPAYGARPLRRAVMRYVEDPVSEFIIADRALSSRKAGADELKALKLILSDDKESTTVVPA